METAVVLASAPVLTLLGEIAAILLYIPIFPTIASALMEVLGCGASVDAMILYFFFGIYYGIRHDSFYGVVHMFAAFSGFVTVVLLCLPSPGTLGGVWGDQCQESLQELARDWEMVAAGKTNAWGLVAKAKKTLNTCF